MKFVWQAANWPQFRWQSRELETILSEVVYRQGLLLGRMQGIGFDLRTQASFETTSEEIVASSAIEGEQLNRADVRSSVARRMEIVLSDPKARHSHALDARVDLVMDATRNWCKPMTAERLVSWQAALFPTGYSGLVRIKTGAFRDDAEGPMRVISRHGSMERIHFLAPPAKRLVREMKSFVRWLNDDASIAPLVKVALGHLRFLTLHPFEDGNGRVARALSEWMLARAERSELRFYSLSSQIQLEKEAYYEEIEHAQRNSLDVTRWIAWFVSCCGRSIESAEKRLSSILAKAEFWQRHAQDDFNDHQRLMLNRFWDGFEGNLTSTKWAKICKVSQDTASREIAPLVAAKVLRQVGGGRSTHYVIFE